MATNRIDRGAFLKLGATLAAGSAGLSACSGEPDDDTTGTGGRGGTGGASGGSAGKGGGSGGSGSGTCSGDATLTHTSSNSHDHLPLTRAITAALLNGAPFEFALPNESGHIHVLTFTETDLASLRAGMPVAMTSSVDGGHTHTYTVKCA
jgi:hypothetical protein